MAVEAFVGLVGGGKSYNSVRRMMAYMARGGRCCSNILLSGYDVSRGAFDSSSPVLPYLRSIGWEYQQGQYVYIPFEDMVKDFTWIQRVPAGFDRQHRTLLVVDEATDLFDSLDGGRLRIDSQYREIFHFLRLSRHVHVDVLFIAQDLSSINTRLRGLVAYIWRSTDMKQFRLAKLKIKFPFDLFMLQQFDRTGKFEVRRDWVKKDPNVFNLYESEAFNNSLSVKWDGVSVDMEKGRQLKKGKKMTIFQKLLLFLAVGLSAWSLFMSSRGGGSVPLCGVGGTNVVYIVSNVVAACGASSVAFSSNDVLVVRGAFKYYPRSNTCGDYVIFDKSKLMPGLPCEWGDVQSVSADMVAGKQFGGGIFYLLPEYEPPKVSSGSCVITRR